jgi:hypothetical protein
VVEAAGTSETSVNMYQTTWHLTPEDGHVYARRRENPNSSSEDFILPPYLANGYGPLTIYVATLLNSVFFSFKDCPCY